MSRRDRRSPTTLIFPIIMLILGVIAATTIASLQNRTDASRRAQIQIVSMRLSLEALGKAAFSASPLAGGSPTTARALMSGDEAAIGRDLRQLAKAAPPRPLADVQSELQAFYPVADEIYEIGASGGGYNGPEDARVNNLQATMMSATARVDTQLAAASAVYDRRAMSARAWATAGSTFAILVLLLVFAFFYFRSVRARRAAEFLSTENRQLLSQSRRDARTDALTQLPNRRALVEDLATKLDHGPGELTLGLFDLDGFKAYNDTFGHVAGDALLQRLGTKLAAAVPLDGKAYRIGGDEFCVLAAIDGETVAATAAQALSESGAGWAIGSSAGTVSVVKGSKSAEELLDIADRRMYADKASRKSLGHIPVGIATDTDHAARAALVERWATSTASALGLDNDSVTVIGAAASMYNAGLRSVPSSIVEHPGDLDNDEWAFVRRHPIVGERLASIHRCCWCRAVG